MDHDSGKGQQWFIIKQKRKILSKENLVLINKILEFRKDCKSKEIQRDIFISLFGPYTAAGSGKSAKCHKKVDMSTFLQNTFSDIWMQA